MKLNDILSPTIRDFRRPLAPMTAATADSDFCHEAVDRGWLTAQQMRHAAQRYRLGRSRSGRTIFWMTDELGQVLDGHIGNGWASRMLRAREPRLLRDWHTEHCLFGLHLLATDRAMRATDCTDWNGQGMIATDGTDWSGQGMRATDGTDWNGQGMRATDRTDWNGQGMRAVAVVELERTAVVLSEIYPDCLWMATTTECFSIDRLEPLQGRRVVVFPSTDETMSNYVFWLEMTELAQRTYKLDIGVSDVLEKNATGEQKQRGIDLVDFLFEQRTTRTDTDDGATDGTDDTD